MGLGLSASRSTAINFTGGVMTEFNRRQMLHNTALAGAIGVGAAVAARGSEGGRSPVLSPTQLDYLRRQDTPTIANAMENEELERILGRSRLEGWMSPKIRCILPELGVMNGYAATATIQASKPADTPSSYDSQVEYWRYIDSVPKPTVMVIHDLDAPNPVGSWWGEVNGNVHRALGCAGVITDGGVRDLPAVRALGFHLFAAEVLVSHCFVHVVDFGKPVEVGGVTVNSGDLVQADEHGAILIPDSVAPLIGQACFDVFKKERALVELCQTPGATLKDLIEFANRR